MNPVRMSYTALLGLVILLFYGAFLALWLGGFHKFNIFWAELWGIYLAVTVDPLAPPIPFFDLYGVLSWRECHLLGLDVMATNPCDPGERQSNYSPLWYLLPTGGVASHLPLGFLLAGLFLAALPLLLRPASRSEFAISALAVISSSALFAVERANVDIIMFLLVLAAIFLWRTGRGWPAYGVILAAAALKFYPLTLLGLAARETPRRLAAILAACSIPVALFIGIFWDELQRLPYLMPAPDYFGDNFGAALFGIGMTDILHLGPSAGPLMTLVLMALCLWGALRAASYLNSILAASFWSSREGALMLGGALLTAGCFLLMANVGYRAIFLLLTLPGFFALRRMGGGPARLAGWSLAAVLYCLYSAIVPAFSTWLRANLLPADRPEALWDNAPELSLFVTREAVWWLLVALLSGVVLAFLRHAPVLALLTGKGGPAPDLAPGTTQSAEI